MKIKSLLIALAFFFTAHQTYAVTAALCNNAKYTQYICCPYTGWNIGGECNNDEHRATNTCLKDTGIVKQTGLPILLDCKNQGGSSLMYPF